MKLIEKRNFPPYVWVFAALWLVYLGVLLKTAWVCDDAYITFRTVDNFVHGRGMTWNVAERVQSFTHPLWMLLVSGLYAITREPYFTSLFASMALSLGAFWIAVIRVPLTLQGGVLVGLGMILSKALTDYSTSGLENPLTHLLLAAFTCAVVSDRRARLFPLALLAGLVGLNRLDLLLIVLPPLGVAGWRSLRSGQLRPLRGLAVLVGGLSPLLAWTSFSVVYYGAPWPNSAYAKLGTGLPRGELVLQGFRYLGDSLAADPITLILTAAGLLVPLVVGSRRHSGLAAGVVLYLAYTVWVGGDFMSGRFLSAPLLVAMLLLSRVAVGRRTGWAAAGVLAVAGLVAPFNPVLCKLDYSRDEKEPQGVSDERGVYYPHTGLLRYRPGKLMPDHPWAERGRAARLRGPRLMVVYSTGFFGYEAGPGVHIIDRYGLSDPLLARLDANGDYFGTGTWRIGHFIRDLPPGYLPTVADGINRIEDPGLAAYYDRLSLITRGPIFSFARWVEIWRFNTGQNRHLLP